MIKMNEIQTTSHQFINTKILFIFQLSLVDYDPSTHDLKTSSLHYFEEEDLKVNYKASSSRMRIDRTVTRSDRVENKNEQWPSIHEADCQQNHRRVWKHYLPLRSVINITGSVTVYCNWLQWDWRHISKWYWARVSPDSFLLKTCSKNMLHIRFPVSVFCCFRFLCSSR